MHSVAKIALFFAAGAIQIAHERTKVSQLGGLGRVMPVTFTAFAIASMSIIGVPIFAGMWAKWYLIAGSLEGGHWAFVNVLLASSLLNLMYLLAITARSEECR